MAGLGAASELARHGISVRVIEAKSRWGGRIYSTGDDTPIELGAEFVHGRSPIPAPEHGRGDMWRALTRLIPAVLARTRFCA